MYIWLLCKTIFLVNTLCVVCLLFAKPVNKLPRISDIFFLIVWYECSLEMYVFVRTCVWNECLAAVLLICKQII